MGTILASAIITEAAIDAFDPGYDRCGVDVWLKWLNAGQKESVILKPDISIQNAARVLVAGTKQTINSNSISFVKLVRNMGTGGATPGAPIRLIDMDKMDLRNPTWHTDTANAVVQAYMFDPADPKTFYVYPQQPTSSPGWVDEVDVITPTTIAAIGNVITIDDIYDVVLLDYLLYRWHNLNSKNNPNAKAKAVYHYGRFVTALGRKDMAENIVSPKKEVKHGN